MCVCCVCEYLLHVNLFFKEIKKKIVRSFFFFFFTILTGLPCSRLPTKIKNLFDLLQNYSLEEFSVEVERS